jgi:hypothetical protein
VLVRPDDAGRPASAVQFAPRSILRKIPNYRHASLQQRRIKDETEWSLQMPKLNARENSRNRTQAKKRERNRILRATLKAPAKTTAKAKGPAAA